MISLIFSEVKKILKNKVNLLLILLILCGIGYVTFEEYHSKAHLPVNSYEQPIALKTLEGKPITSVKELNSYASSILSKYTGIVDKKEAWKTYQQDYNQLYDQLTASLDIETMKKCYGDEYTRIPNIGMLSDAGEFYHKVINDLGDFDVEGNVIYYYDETNDSAYLPAFYEKQAELYTLNYIYRNDIQASYLAALTHQGDPYLTDDITSFSQAPLYYYANKDQLALQIQTTTSFEQNKEGIFEVTKDVYNNKAIDKAINNKVMSTNYTFGSTFEMERFKYSFTKFTFFSLLLIAILLSNSFAIENRTKVDQIITPTRIGYGKITVAKLIAGLGIAMLCFLLQFLCILIISYLSIDMSGLSLSMSSSADLSIYTYADYMFTRFQMLSLATIAIAMLTMFLSCVFKNQFISVVIVILFIMLPYLMTSVIPESILKLLPSSFTDYDFLTPNYTYGIPYLVIFDHVVMWKTIVTWFWILASAVMTMVMLGKARYHTVANR